jgi:hypothetical protein
MDGYPLNFQETIDKKEKLYSRDRVPSEGRASSQGTL